MTELVSAIDRLNSAVYLLCMIQFFMLIFKDMSGSYKLGQIKSAIDNADGVRSAIRSLVGVIKYSRKENP